jgi:transcriptional regulator with XRE-family HTH domain
MRLLHERGLKKSEFANLAGISVSFISDLTKDKANPSLKVMSAIADAFQIPLPMLLKDINAEEWVTLRSLSEAISGKNVSTPDKKIPIGYVEVNAVLPLHKAYIIKKWESEANVKKRRKIAK